MNYTINKEYTFLKFIYIHKNKGYEKNIYCLSR